MSENSSLIYHRLLVKGYNGGEYLIYNDNNYSFNIKIYHWRKFIISLSLLSLMLASIRTDFFIVYYINLRFDGKFNLLLAPVL